VTYTAISFDGAVNTRFLYRLEGYDRDWIDAGSRRQAYYTHLPPGRYRFQVKARNSDGVWNEMGASIALELLPHFHQTAWFAALVALLLGLGTWRAYALGVRLRTQTIQRRNQALQAEIVERLRVERELEANNVQLEARNAEMERFVYTASHDLKTPLVTINGYVGLLERTVAEVVPDPVAGKQIADDLARVGRAADTMRGLLDDLLQLSKVGQPIREPGTVDLSEAAREAAALVIGGDEDRARAVSIDSSMPRVHGDRMRLIEVYQNLIENALKFLGEPDAPRVEVGARQETDEILCWVRDNGIGIDARYQERIFGLFERLDQSMPGTGIGLAVVKRVIEAHGGRIWVESEGAGRGCTFYFTLPPAKGPDA
jgi:signal transduction histidine kinase